MSSLVFLVLVIISITIHEYAHGFVAVKLGDLTPKESGRLTLNPIAHIDIFGTIVLPILMQLTVGVPFGYAKPVPINPYHFRNPRKDTMFVGLAGPAANIGTAILLSLIVHIVPDSEATGMLLSLVAANMLLAIFNLIPIPPLDGSKIIAAFLPSRWYYSYLKLQIYGIVIILILSLGGFFDWFFQPVVRASLGLLGLGRYL